MKPFFSIVIPTLNEEKFLPDLLDDLASQTEKDFEVIVVDGKSEDGTKEICLRENRYDLRVIEVEQQNVSTQRNNGAAVAKGEYIIFIDADSRIDSEFIKTARKEIAASGYLIYIPTMVPDNPKPPYGIYLTLSNLAVELSQSTPRPFSNSGTFLISRLYFSHLGGFDEKLKLSEDHEIIARAHARGVSAKFLHSLKFTFSLRRYEADGLLEILMKYTIALFYQITNTRMEKELFSYEMGGKRYSVKHQKKILDQFKNLYKKVMNSLEETF